MTDELRYTIINAALFLIAAGTIILVGWKEPLRYRFMSPAEIAAAERELYPIPEVPPPQEIAPPHPATPSPFDRPSRFHGGGH